MNGQCLENSIVYHAKITQSDQKVTNYIGMTSTEFKKRLGVHRQTFKDHTVSQTSLSKHIHTLKSQNIDYEITWNIVDWTRPGNFHLFPMCVHFVIVKNLGFSSAQS